MSREPSPAAPSTHRVTASEAARRLKISRDEILLLRHSELLRGELRRGSWTVRASELEGFALTVALGLDEGEPFDAGIRRFVAWARQLLIEPNPPANPDPEAILEHLDELAERLPAELDRPLPGDIAAPAAPHGALLVTELIQNTELTIEGLDATTAIIRLRGVIEVASAAALATICAQAAGQGFRSLILDFSQVSAINSAGLGCLVKMADGFKSQGGGLALINVPKKIRIMIEMLGLNAFLDLAGSIKAARRILAQPGPAKAPARLEKPAVRSPPLPLRPPAPPPVTRVMPKPPAPTTRGVRYLSKEEAASELQIDRAELKKLVVQGELRGFRAGEELKFKADDISNLKSGRETEATTFLADSDQELGLAESSDELIRYDSNITIGDIKGHGRAASSLDDIEYDRAGVDEDAATESEAFEDTDDLTATRCSMRDSSMETEAFSLMEESGETDGFMAEVQEPTGASSGEAYHRGRSDSKTSTQTAAFAEPEESEGAAQEAGGGARRLTRAMSIAPHELPPPPPTGAFMAAPEGRKRAASREPAKKRSEAPSESADRGAAAPGQPVAREIETIERRTTVRFFKQMYVQRSYPLFVIISQHAIKKIVHILVDQAASKKAFQVKASNPIVHIRPIFPGCLCIPTTLDLDVTERIAEAEFWLTPNAPGDLSEARVEVLYEGKVVDSIPVECRATTQGLAKVSGNLTFVTTTFGPSFREFGATLEASGAEWLGGIFQVAGSEHGPMVASGLLGFLTLIFYLWNRPKEGAPIEAMFDYEADQPPPGDPHVIAQRGRLVLIARAGRQKFELMEQETTLGRSSECLVVLGERSVEPRHALIRFDGDTQRFLARPLGGALKVDGLEVNPREGSGERPLGREAVLELSAEAHLWFFDERLDEAGYDRPEMRRRIEERLIEAFGNFADQIRRVLRDPRHKSVRAALAALMLEGILTPSRWALVRKANGHFQ